MKIIKPKSDHGLFLDIRLSAEDYLCFIFGFFAGLEFCSDVDGYYFDEVENV